MNKFTKLWKYITFSYFYQIEEIEENNKKDEINIRVIKLKILNCSSKDSWYKNKIGKSFYFFHNIFDDDEHIKSIWLASVPTKKYCYLDHTNYNSVIRKHKLKKLEKL